VIELANKIQQRIDEYCMHHDPGIHIAVTTPEPEQWDSIPWPDTLHRYGWLDPAETDGHISGWAFPYQPELMAASVTGLTDEQVDDYLDAVLLYVTLYVRLDGFTDADERRRKVEDLMYDNHPERLTLLSRVQTGQAR
jgi:hypothetical protein